MCNGPVTGSNTFPDTGGPLAPQFAELIKQMTAPTCRGWGLGDEIGAALS